MKYTKINALEVEKFVKGLRIRRVKHTDALTLTSEMIRADAWILKR